jgi:hypothetical protein
MGTPGLRSQLGKAKLPGEMPAVMALGVTGCDWRRGWGVPKARAVWELGGRDLGMQARGAGEERVWCRAGI